MTTNQTVINQEMEKWVVVAAIKSAKVKRKPNVYRGLVLFLAC
ncbi:hypothetical protein [Vibrio rotiferianus]|jgi:hypothetical protein|nr:hypothetical protein [Vibrio rotiferianus]